MARSSVCIQRAAKLGITEVFFITARLLLDTAGALLLDLLFHGTTKHSQGMMTFH